MARPRTFDTDTIRVAILRQFWAHGFEGSGLSDLEVATQLSRKSLYNALGDKQAMFLAALTQFRHHAVRENLKPLHKPDAGRAQIGEVLNGLAQLARTADGALGCMICNTSREDIAANPLVRSQIDGYFQDMETAFLTAIERGQSRGDIKDRDPTALARLCLGAVVSISVLSKAGQAGEVLDAIAAETIAAL